MPLRLTIPERLKPLRREHPFSRTNAVWIAVVAAVVVTVLAILLQFDWSAHSLPKGFRWVFTLVSNAVLFLLLFFYSFYILRNNVGGRLRLLVAVAGSVAISLLFTVLSGWLKTLYDDAPPSSIFSDVTVLRDMMLAVVAILITLLLYNLSRRFTLATEAEHLQAENIMTHYRALESQVDPHFLFNSLNTLDGLIGLDDEKARDYLRHLAASYRYIMQHTDTVTLSDELRFATDYIYMMQIRYGDALRVEQHIDPSLLGRLLPPISLQLLVENAIKHNVVTTRRPLTIVVATTERGTISVSNPLQPKQDTEQSTGIGLDNLNQRYLLVCKKNIVVTNDGHNFCVELPLM